MILTLGITQIIYIVLALLYIVVFFVGASYGKRVGRKGGTIKSAMNKEISALEVQAIKSLKEAKALVKAKYLEDKANSDTLK